MEIKDIFIWLGIFIVGSLIVSFLVYPNSLQSFKSNVNGVVPNINLPEKSVGLEQNNYCKENIIPKNVVFDFPADDFDYRKTSFQYLASTWKDGTAIGIFGDNVDELFYKCRNGENEGENQNYVYCDELKYSKTPIAEGGTIGETINYNVDLVLNNVGSEEVEGSYAWKIILKQTYEIVEYDCNKVKE